MTPPDAYRSRSITHLERTIATLKRVVAGNQWLVEHAPPRAAAARHRIRKASAELKQAERELDRLRRA